MELSEQELVECDTQSSVCTNGNVTYAFQYAKENGLTAAKEYQYKAQAGKCDSKSKPRFAKIKSYKRVKEGGENLLEVVAQ